ESRPASAVVRLRDGKHEERWLLADGWWADAFLPPSYRELVSWSVKAIPWAFAMHIAQRFWQSDQDTKQNGAKQGDANPNDLLKHPGALILAIGEMSVALAFAPLFVILLALALILGLLPIPQLRTFILAAQGNLVSTVGDCFAFVESPVRAALIRTRILNGLEWLKERCEQTIMVAHSQGAAVVLDSLGAIGVAKDDGSPRFEELGSNQMPDALVTFGAGTNQLAGLKTLTAGLPSKIGPNPVFYALWLLIFTISTIGWLGTAMLSHQTSIKQVLVTVGLLLGSVVLYGLIVGGISNVVARFGKRANDTALKKWATDEGLTSVEVHKYLTAPEYAAKREELLLEIGKKRKERILIPVLLWTMLPLVVGFVWLAETSKLPIFPVSLIGLASLFLLMLIFGILLMKAAVTTVRMPPGLRCWIDIFASADPVPNGRTRIVPSESGAPKSESRFKSIPIWNLGSLFADHTAYWDNLDGFVLRVARACAETARSPWKNKLPPESSEVDERAKWRVGWLRLARWAIQASWLGGGAALWIWHGKDVPMPFSLPGWLPAIATSAARLALFAAAIALAARGSCGVFQLIWGIWARSEQKTVLAHQPLGGEKFWSRKELWPLVGMGMVVTIFIVLALAAVRDDLSLTNTSELVSLVLVFLSPAALLILLLIRLRPAPQVAQRETEAAQRSRLTSAEPLGS
ncbi:MAG TPA: hypothetical protein VK513_18905, partial [Terriglobales bacterium]|nr:hypothetical protein [Terriglobales bacterium]